MHVFSILNIFSILFTKIYWSRQILDCVWKTPAEFPKSWLVWRWCIVYVYICKIKTFICSFSFVIPVHMTSTASYCSHCEYSENFYKNTLHLNVSRAHHFLIYFSFSSNFFLSSYFTPPVLCFLSHVDKGSLWISISFTFLPFPEFLFSSLVLWLLLGAKFII